MDDMAVTGEMERLKAENTDLQPRSTGAAVACRGVFAAGSIDKDAPEVGRHLRMRWSPPARASPMEQAIYQALRHPVDYADDIVADSEGVPA